MKNDGVQRESFELQYFRDRTVVFDWALTQTQDCALLLVQSKEPTQIRLKEVMTDEQIRDRNLLEEEVIDTKTSDMLQRDLDTFCQLNCVQPGQECQMRGGRKEG